MWWFNAFVFDYRLIIGEIVRTVVACEATFHTSRVVSFIIAVRWILCLIDFQYISLSSFRFSARL